MQGLNTSLAVTNETQVRGVAMLALIRKYLTFRDGYYGFKSLGVSEEKIKFPVIFVQPRSQDAVMIGTAKWHITITYSLYWYVRDNKLQDVLAQVTNASEALVKLFSNNALGDLTTATTNKFKQYANPAGGYFWLEAVIKGMDWTVPYLNPQVQPDARYECAGRMTVDIMDVILK